MELKTKFSPGQTLFGMYDNRVAEFLIEKVEVRCSLDYETMKPYCTFHILYELRINMSAGSRRSCYESELEHNYYSSKEELLKSL